MCSVLSSLEAKSLINWPCLWVDCFGVLHFAWAWSPFEEPLPYDSDFPILKWIFREWFIFEQSSACLFCWECRLFLLYILRRFSFLEDQISAPIILQFHLTSCTDTSSIILHIKGASYSAIGFYSSWLKKDFLFTPLHSLVT